MSLLKKDRHTSRRECAWTAFFSPKGANLLLAEINWFFSGLKSVPNCFLWTGFSKWCCRVLCCVMCEQSWRGLLSALEVVLLQCWDTHTHTHLLPAGHSESSRLPPSSQSLFIHFASCFQTGSPLRNIAPSKRGKSLLLSSVVYTQALHHGFLWYEQKVQLRVESALQSTQSHLVAKLSNFTGGVLSLLHSLGEGSLGSWVFEKSCFLGFFLQWMCVCTS